MLAMVRVALAICLLISLEHRTINQRPIRRLVNRPPGRAACSSVPLCSDVHNFVAAATKNALAFPALGVEGVRRQTDCGARGQRMLYLAYQAHSDIMVPVRAWASVALAAGNGRLHADESGVLRNLTAAYELISRAGLTHTRPPSASTSVNGRQPRGGGARGGGAVCTPFGTLLHFKKDIEHGAAARSGGRAAVRAFRHAVARDRAHACWPSTTSTSPIGTMRATCRCAHGRFGFDEYVDHLIQFLEAIGPGAHIVAVCQPCVAVLGGGGGHGAKPATRRSRARMTLMAGPIDTRISPTKVNQLALEKPIAWFEKHSNNHRVPQTIPPEGGRRVFGASCSLPHF